MNSIWRLTTAESSKVTRIDSLAITDRLTFYSGEMTVNANNEIIDSLCQKLKAASDALKSVIEWTEDGTLPPSQREMMIRNAARHGLHLAGFPQYGD